MFRLTKPIAQLRNARQATLQAVDFGPLFPADPNGSCPGKGLGSEKPAGKREESDHALSFEFSLRHVHRRRREPREAHAQEGRSSRCG